MILEQLKRFSYSWFSFVEFEGESMSRRVWVLGDAVVDLVPDDQGRYLKCPGGAPANVAVGVSRLGGDSAFIGRVGADPFGRFLRHVLELEGVETETLMLDPEHATSTVVVDLDEQGERTFTFLVKPSADLFLTDAELPDFKSGQWLHLCSIALSRSPSREAAFAAMTAIRAAGGFVSFDPNLRPAVWSEPEQMRPNVERALQLADVVKLSQEELEWLTGEADLALAMDQVLARFPLSLLLVTLGAEGLLVQDRQERRHIAAFKVKPVDTTGAGDAFVAGLLAGLARLDTLGSLDSLLPVFAQAQACGALATTALGAMTALPSSLALQELRQGELAC